MAGDTWREDFSSRLCSLRKARGFSLSDLARAVNYDRSYVHHVENRRRNPSRQFAADADRVLEANGELLAAWVTADSARRQSCATQRLVSQLANESDQFAAQAAEAPIVDLAQKVVDLATTGQQATQTAIFDEAASLRSTLLSRLRTGPMRAGDHADLLLGVGRVSGILAYASLDMGHPDAALSHSRAAWTAAEMLDDNELRIWVRGTQSLIARFKADYDQALAFALSGLGLTARGTGRIRLLCGKAQCLANLGDASGAFRALNEARDARESVTTADSLPGMFGFSETKQLYYTGSSLIWVPTRVNAMRAASDASQAIAAWESGKPEDRSIVDENLARIYLGTARLQMRELEGAVESVRPVLAFAAQYPVSWITKRMERFAHLLRSDYANAALAVETRAVIGSLTQ